MPIIAYFLIEALAFWGVSQLVGVGWALFGIFALMLVGALAASPALRSELARAQAGNGSVGQFAGGTALVAAGWALAILPGYVTSVIGLLLLLRPTRELVRRSLAKSLQKRIEDFGVQVYDASPMKRHSASYGTFGDGGDVIDAEPEPSDEDISKWSENARPEDFGDPQK